MMHRPPLGELQVAFQDAPPVVPHARMPTNTYKCVSALRFNWTDKIHCHVIRNQVKVPSPVWTRIKAYTLSMCPTATSSCERGLSPRPSVGDHIVLNPRLPVSGQSSRLSVARGGRSSVRSKHSYGRRLLPLVAHWMGASLRGFVATKSLFGEWGSDCKRGALLWIVVYASALSWTSRVRAP